MPRALFALDHNYPLPILSALAEYIPEAELVPLSEIDPRLPLLADHYHARILRSPTQVANALAYVLMNFLHHFPDEARRYAEDPRDRFSSAWREDGTDPPVVAARTWLLTVGWRIRSAEVLLRIVD